MKFSKRTLIIAGIAVLAILGALLSLHFEKQAIIDELESIDEPDEPDEPEQPKPKKKKKEAQAEPEQPKIEPFAGFVEPAITNENGE